MESSWTNKHAILRDLSVAQGREVPVEIKDTISKDEKPPSVSHMEETEKEFFENCVSNGDFSTGPDITLIQQMLHLVRDYNVTDVCKGNDEGVLEIGKINHEGSGDGCHLSQNIVQPLETEKKRKRRRNVAVDSLLEAYGENSYSHNNTDNNPLESKQPILLKPNDIISDTQMNVNQCMNPLDNQKERKNPAVVSPIIMFKKKFPSQKTVEVVPKQSPISGKSSPLNTPVSFVPSSQAAEYYKKYVQRSELQEKVKEDTLWTRAEEKMKYNENKRNQENMLLCSSQENNDDKLHGMDIEVTDNCHSLSEDCIETNGLCDEKI